ncbi:MAG: outer membrane protein assembly factor BamC, partial [Gammaproteobacteria bacterium]
MNIRYRLLASILVLLPGCNFLAGDEGVFRDRGGDYTEAVDLPPMQIPVELDSYTIDPLYVIPNRLLVDTDVFAEEIPKPKPLETRRREGVIIQNLGDRRWILIDATPAQVWPLVRDYWTELSVSLDYENPGAGIMETAWLEIDSDATSKHKYRITIEPGLHSGYSEVYVRHLEQPRSEPDPPVITWPEDSSSIEREQQLSRTISQYLADRNDIYQASTASLLAG